MISLLVLQATPFCNIACDYCYLPNRTSRRRMSLGIVEQTVGRLLESDLVGSDLGVVWHAGEPLVAPITFYEAAFDTIDRLTAGISRVVYSVQTNGVLLDQSWCDFVKARNVQVGLSLDGPPFVHDAHRKTRGGRGTHARVMRAVELLQANAIPFHVIAVVTAAALEHPDEIFRFFLDRGIYHVGFNVEEVEGANGSSSLFEDGNAVRYRRFMRRMHELARVTGDRVRIREFDHAQFLIRVEPVGAPVGRRSHANHQIEPFGIVTVDCDGNFSTFSPELLGQAASGYGNFVFGNVRTDSLASSAASPRFLRVLSEIEAGVERCRQTCQYFDLCGGGAPANKFYEHGSFEATETSYCRFAIQAPIDLVLEELEAGLTNEHGPRGGEREVNAPPGGMLRSWRSLLKFRK